MKLKLRGYVFSREFNGQRVPQHIQNIVIRDFCRSNNHDFLFSSVEYSIENSYIILNEFLSFKDFSDGMVFYSLFQLPRDSLQRKIIYKKFLSKSKKLFFAQEDLSLNSLSVKNIEDIFLIKNTIKDCPKKQYLKLIKLGLN